MRVYLELGLKPEDAESAAGQKWIKDFVREHLPTKEVTIICEEIVEDPPGAEKLIYVLIMTRFPTADAVGGNLRSSKQFTSVWTNIQVG